MKLSVAGFLTAGAMMVAGVIPTPAHAQAAPAAPAPSAPAADPQPTPTKD